MTDSLKFGPEWIRNLASDGCNTGGGLGGGGSVPPRYQLAEHSYGREEMLALFDRHYKPPEPLTSFTGLYIQKTQLPLALIQMTEEEARLWTGGVSTAIGRGRGGSVDRGRARTARTGPHFRGVGFDDLGEVPRAEPQPFSARTRAFDRPPTERGWAERNGVDPVEWNGSTSPRKELNRGVSGSFLMESNWRRHRGGGEEDDGWRTNARGEKWVKSSWRDAEKERAERVDVDEDKRGERWDHKGGNRAFDPHPPPIRRNRSNHHDSHDLPEWATENPSESGGSFDASGAFHGIYSDDEDDEGRLAERKRGSRVRRVSEGSATVKPSVQGPAAATSKTPPRKNDRPLNGERPKSMHDDRDGSRRSLSPIDSHPEPSSPIGKKPPQQQSNNVDQKKKDKAKSGKEPVQANPSTPKAKQKGDGSKKEEPKSKVEQKSKGLSKGEETTRAETRKELEKAGVPSGQMQLPNDQVFKQLQQQFREQQKQQTNSVIDQSDDKSKEDSRIEEEMTKLIEGASSRDEKPPAPGLLQSIVGQASVLDQATVVQASAVHEKWFYRDPQGEVQGPFLASEMAEWHKQGYFAPNLLVRRTCDERYTTLGDLIHICGTVPFKMGTNFPPLKLNDTLLPPSVAGLGPAGLTPGAGLPKPNNVMEDPLLMYQFQQYRMLQNQQQQMFLKQLRATAINKLSQTDQWPSLSPVEQNQLVMQYMRTLDPELLDITQSQPPPSVVPNAFMPTMPQSAPQPPSNSVLQLFPQLHQAAKTQAETVSHVGAPSQHVVSPAQQLSGSTPIDPIQHLMQHMSGIRNLPPMPQPTIAPTLPQPQPQTQSSSQEDNVFQSFLRQHGVNTNTSLQSQPTQPHLQSPMDSLWHQPPPHLTNVFNAANWMSQVGAIQPAISASQLGGTLWDVHPKEMKTEQQILEEQNLKIQEEKKREELRKKEELDRQQVELERVKRQHEKELARMKAEEVAKREEIERTKREEEKKRRDEEKRRIEEEQRKLDEKKRKEEEKKREEKRKHDEEANKKKQEEEKRKRDELKRQEEKLRKEEEKRKKIEEEQKKLEEEKLRKEEEIRKKAEAEEQAKKAEQRRREAEALRKLQERSKAPWAQAAPAPPPTAQASLAEIQRLEREKKAEELRLQQMLQQQVAQQKALEAAQEALTDSAKRLQFKWAEKAVPANNVNQVKSLAQIQQEEQERIAKVKQEKERQEKEKANQKEASIAFSNVNIWSVGGQSLNWSNTANPANQIYAAGGSGFWDEPTPKATVQAPKTINAAAPKPVPKQQQQQPQVTTKSPVQQAQSQQQQQQLQLQQQQQQQQLQQQQLQQQQLQSNKVVKNKNKKEEEVVKKIFEQTTAKTDDFTQWCNKALTGLQVSVDIPTFVGFLRDIEAAYEVKEYVRLYLGDGKQCSEFAKQFLEKRSKWRSAQRPQTQADDLCKPAPAINPNASTEFQEVKSKSKKPKKGKMYKVDSKMLGFSVMSAPDRINVGDRDYAEGV